MFMLGFPLLLIPFAIYNIIAFLMPGVAWSSVVSTVHMMSGVDWTMTTGDVLVALAILLLCGEVMKSSNLFSSSKPPPRHFSCSSSWASSTCSAASRLLCARPSETLRLRVSSVLRPE